MTIAATGVRGESLQKLEALIAASATVQTRTGLSAGQIAAQRIAWPHLDDPASVAMPFFVLTPGGSRGTKDSSNTFNRSGALKLKILDVAGDVGTIAGLKDALTRFCNLVDGLIADLEEGSIADDNLTIQAWNDTIPIGFSDPRKNPDPDAKKPYFFTEIEITWDPSGAG